MTKLDDLTIGEAKQLAALFGGNNSVAPQSTLNSMIGEKVVIRTYTAGVFFGTLDQKAGSEVILKDARRMWTWWAKKSISLSGCALYGIQDAKSKIAPAVDYIWLDAIEIIPCTKEAIKSIEGAKDAEAQ
jgi:hypothetical protein